MVLYFKGFFSHLLLTVLCGGMSLGLFTVIRTPYVFVNLVLGVIVSAAVPVGVNFFVFGRSEEWKYCTGMVMNIVHKVLRRG